MSALETFLKRYPDGENYAPHCFEFYETGYLDGEMFQFQITKSLEQQIQGHVLEVLKLREELKTLAASGLEAVKYHQAELATLRPAAEALKTAVELEISLDFTNDSFNGKEVWANHPVDYCNEPYCVDPLSATIKAINRAAEQVKGEKK